MEKKPKPKIPSFIAVIIILLVGFLLWNWLSRPDDKTPINGGPVASAHVVSRQESVDNFAPAYCENHKTMRPVVDNFLKQENWPTNDGTHPWSVDDCRTIVGKLYDDGSTQKSLEAVSKGNYGIGMGQKELLYSIGQPDRVNSTTTANGTHDQYAYGSSNYIYLDNGVVTATQD